MVTVAGLSGGCLLVFYTSNPTPHRLGAVKASCLNCQLEICMHCKVKWHGELTCDEYMALPEESRDPDDMALHALLKKSKWQRCPLCQAGVERTQGCNHIKCTCGGEICYACGSVYEKRKGQGFQNQHGYATCKCKLFDSGVCLDGDRTTTCGDKDTDEHCRRNFFVVG